MQHYAEIISQHQRISVLAYPTIATSSLHRWLIRSWFHIQKFSDLVILISKFGISCAWVNWVIIPIWESCKKILNWLYFRDPFSVSIHRISLGMSPAPSLSDLTTLVTSVTLGSPCSGSFFYGSIYRDRLVIGVSTWLLTPSVSHTWDNHTYLHIRDIYLCLINGITIHNSLYGKYICVSYTGYLSEIPGCINLLYERLLSHC